MISILRYLPVFVGVLCFVFAENQENKFFLIIGAIFIVFGVAFLWYTAAPRNKTSELLDSLDLLDILMLPARGIIWLVNKLLH